LRTVRYLPPTVTTEGLAVLVDDGVLEAELAEVVVSALATLLSRPVR
jgi:hypothetical protein